MALRAAVLMHSVIGGMEVICRITIPKKVKGEHYEDYTEYRVYDEDIREECDAVALGAWRALGAVDAGRVDMKADRNGGMCFIEANPLAGQTLSILTCQCSHG
ncbi:MAG: hypothetical protein MZV63_33215 [Marinilabiliales bacterium]|nr:hypothetical protein [Marinilabiliales bacterium]